MLKIAYAILVLFLVTFGNGQSLENYFNEASIKSGQNDFRTAITILSTAIEKYPTSSRAYTSRGLMKFQLEDYWGAIQDFNKAIEVEPAVSVDSYLMVHYALGNAKIALKDFHGAIQDFNKVIELRPYEIGALSGRGSAKFNIEDYRGAIQDFNIAIRLDPNNSFSYYKRGTTKYQLDDKEGACLDWSKAGELGYASAYIMIEEYCNN
jgi:tetratricopeptide (TPR) repeat protein